MVRSCVNDGQHSVYVASFATLEGMSRGFIVVMTVVILPIVILMNLGGVMALAALAFGDTVRGTVEGSSSVTYTVAESDDDDVDDTTSTSTIIEVRYGTPDGSSKKDSFQVTGWFRRQHPKGSEVELLVLRKWPYPAVVRSQFFQDDGVEHSIRFLFVFMIAGIAVFYMIRRIAGRDRR